MPETILVVEDESIIAADLQIILEDLGYNVPAIADSGELAIEKSRLFICRSFFGSRSL
jgi:CheY-like chemotaxis protein